MDKVLNLALMVVSEMQAADNRRAGPRPTTTSAMCMAFATIAITGGFGCAVAAFWIYLADHFGMLGAASGTAIALILTGIVLVAISRSYRMPDTPSDFKSRDPLDDLRQTFVQNKGSALIAAVLAGLAAGARR